MNGGASAPYTALVAKVDAFCANVSKQRADDLVCRQGCASCCLVELSVSRVEAEGIEQALEGLDDEAQDRLAARLSARLSKRQHAEQADTKPRCIMLEEDGACAVYEARPLVCRTQGLALRYPPGPFPIRL